MNNGYKKYNTLLRVVDGGPYDGLPLDENGELTSISGLPQASKPNVDTDPDYVEPIYDPIECPIPLLTLNLNYELTNLVNDAGILVQNSADNETIISEIVTSSTTNKTISTSILGTMDIIITNNDSVNSLDYTVTIGSNTPLTGTILVSESVELDNLTKEDITIELVTNII